MCQLPLPENQTRLISSVGSRGLPLSRWHPRQTHDTLFRLERFHKCKYHVTIPHPVKTQLYNYWTVQKIPVTYRSNVKRLFPVCSLSISFMSSGLNPFQSLKMLMFCLTWSILFDLGIGIQPIWYFHEKSEIFTFLILQSKMLYYFQVSYLRGIVLLSDPGFSDASEPVWWLLVD